MPTVRRLLFWTSLATLIAAAGALAQTTPVSASYDEHANVLTIRFSGPVHTEAGYVIVDGLRLDDDLGGGNADLYLRGGQVTNTSAVTVNLKLKPIFDGVIDNYTYVDADGNEDPRNCWGPDLGDVATIENSLGRDNLRLWIPEGCTTDADGNNVSSGWVDVEYVATAPADQVLLTGMTYNADTNTMRYEFNRTMRFDSIAEDIAGRSTINPSWPAPGNGQLDVSRNEDRNGNGVLDMAPFVDLTKVLFRDDAGGQFSPSSVLDITRKDSTVLEMTLAPSNQFAMEALDLSTLTVSFGKYAFVDVDYNSVEEVIDEPVTVIEESNPLEVVSASYNMGLNTFTVRFNQALGAAVNDYAVIPKVSIIRGTGEDAETHALSGGTPGLADGDSSLIVNTVIADAHAIEDLIDASPSADYTSQVLPNAVLSAGGNGNRAGTGPLTVIPEDANNKAPEIDPATPVTYDAVTNVLTITFDVRLENTVNLDGISFISDTDTLTLTGGEFERVNGNKGIAVTLTDVDRHALESYPDKGALQLWVAPYSVFQQRQMNGNRNIVTDFDYTADTNPPLVNYIWYDSLNGRVVVGANVAFDAAAADLSKLTFDGITLADPDSIHVDEVQKVSFYLPSDLTDQLDALSTEQKLNVTVSFDADFITNDDGVANVAAADLTDKAMVSNGSQSEEILLGWGRSFFVKSQEVFQTPTRIAQASLRGSTEHADWYVDNDQWVPYNPMGKRDERVSPHPIVNPFSAEELDSAMVFFEQQTAKDPSRGAYDLVRDVFAGNGVDLVPNKIDVLFADVYDEYGQGRNDSNVGFWKPGIFDPNDLPGSTTANSNEDELIIIDSYPQNVIPGGQAYKWNTNNEVWDPITGSSLTALTSGTRALTNLYTEYVSYKVDPFEATWVRKGFAYLSEFLVASPPDFYGLGVAKGFGGDNSLVFIGSDLSYRSDYVHTYMYFLYLYEKYGGMDVIRQIAESPYIGMDAIQRVLTKRSTDGLLAEWLSTDVLNEYLDFATANLIDTTYGDDHRKYAFTNIVAQRGVPGTQRKWATVPGVDRAPYDISVPEWGFTYNYTGYGLLYPNPGLNPATDSLVIFAGKATDNLALRKVNIRAEVSATSMGEQYYIQDIDLNPTVHAGSVPMNPENETDGDWIFGPAGQGNFPTWVLVAAGEGSFKMTNKSQPADYTRLFIAQNPAFSRKLDVYVVSQLPVYNQDGSQAPIVYATTQANSMGDTLAWFDSPDDYEMIEVENAGGRFLQYKTTTWAQNEGTVYWYLQGYYDNGIAVAGGAPTTVTVDRLPGGQPGSMAMGNDCILQTTAYSLPNDLDVSIVRNPASDNAETLASLPLSVQTPVSDVFSIAPSNYELSDPASLTIAFDSEKAQGEDIGVFYQRNGQWEYIGGQVNGDNGTITVRIANFGKFRVLAGQLGELASDLSVPTAYRLNQNYPNPFNPSTTIEMSLPNTGHVSLIVYDVLGREVTRLLDNRVRFGTHRVVWDGRSASGSPLSSGVYFVRMNARGFHDVKKMILVK